MGAGYQRSELREIGLVALVLLFFVQMLTVWIESIYRMSLVKLSMGVELLGILLPLLFLVLLMAGHRHERTVLAACFILLLAARVLCPILRTPWLILAAGLGVTAFLAIVCVALTHPRRATGRDAAAGAGIAILLSVGLRAWGSSYDISLGGPFAWLGWVMVVLAGALGLTRSRASTGESAETAAPNSFVGALTTSVALFANIAVFYLVLSSPGVVSAWSGSNYAVGIALLAAAVAAATCAWRNANPTRLVLAVWNTVFVGALVAGLWRLAPALPETPAADPVFAVPASWRGHLLLYLMLALSPVTLFNLAAIERGGLTNSLRKNVLAVLSGAAFLVLIIVLLVFTNVWGYVGAAGPLLRNMFYLPFLVAGIGMVLPLALPVRHGPVFSGKEPQRSRATAALAGMLALIAVAGVAARQARPPAMSDRHELRVLTYNFQQGSAADGQQDYWGQLEFLRKAGADVVGLQESDTARPSGGNVDAPRFFAESLGYYCCYGPGTVAGTFGTAILSRFPLEKVRTFFTYSNADEIGTAAAEFEAGGRHIAIFNNHPAGSHAAHDAHVNALMAQVTPYEHVIAVGDFNFRQSSSYYAKVAAVLRDSWRTLYPDAKGAPHPDWVDGSPAVLDMTDRIDHVFVSPGFEVTEAYYVPPPASRTDHPAHWAVIRWR